MSFNYDLDQLSLEELISLFHAPSPEEDGAYLYYQEIASMIRTKGQQGIAFLLSEIDRADTTRLRAILFALTEPRLDQPAIRDLLLSYLQDERPIIVSEAIDSLRRQGEKDTLEQVLPSLGHSSPYVRGSVLRFVSALHPEMAWPLLINALQDPDFIVRENAADELGELGAVEAIPFLRPLLLDSHPDVQEAALTAIELLESVQEDTAQSDH